MPPLLNLIALIILLALAGYLIYEWMLLNGRTPTQRRLLQTGQRAEATILDVIATDSYFARRAMRAVVVVLEVRPEDRPPYTVRIKRAAAVQGNSPYVPGMQLIVRFNPANPRQIALFGLDG
jgi:hypothetical protein